VPPSSSFVAGHVTSWQRAGSLGSATTPERAVAQIATGTSQRLALLNPDGPLGCGRSLPSGLRAGGLHWHAGLLPCRKAAQQGLGVGVSQIHEHARCTGALLLLASGAVQKDLLVLWQFAQPGTKFSLRDGYRTRGVSAGVRFLAANVHQQR
jgi:hypothetical protein